MQVKTAIYDHALSAGFDRGFEVSTGIMLVALISTIAAVRGQARRPGRRPDHVGYLAAGEASAEIAEAGKSGWAGPPRLMT